MCHRSSLFCFSSIILFPPIVCLPFQIRKGEKVQEIPSAVHVYLSIMFWHIFFSVSIKHYLTKFYFFPYPLQTQSLFLMFKSQLSKKNLTLLPPNKPPSCFSCLNRQTLRSLPKARFLALLAFGADNFLS
jgi:hypothetical protein